MRVYILWSDEDGEPFIPLAVTTEACARDRFGMSLDEQAGAAADGSLRPQGGRWPGARWMVVEIPGDALTTLFAAPLVPGEVIL